MLLCKTHSNKQNQRCFNDSCQNWFSAPSTLVSLNTCRRIHQNPFTRLQTFAPAENLNIYNSWKAVCLEIRNRYLTTGLKRFLRGRRESVTYASGFGGLTVHVVKFPAAGSQLTRLTEKGGRKRFLITLTFPRACFQDTYSHTLICHLWDFAKISDYGIVGWLPIWVL